ncbi:MAG: patatin [Bdellovibrio sp. CG12_big_fil_rev_8_21_14_0_65_39_13]|nr:MAG: patatin [Bdellovibrio sp. CG22_combo_CG10-13_8_21_14_all_39_27]PIQ59816.1 MAG: patatin [Bdellovibrio sp. CG12_big_fil_rev_8_21_14_0_65_39_13]PIR36156.1 MAG: patatin [Bdellovibrio sp. CG11_big_fil_rev_8_21_14_0_20_39_38]
MFKRKLGLALGGGGARGLAHLGVIKHLNEIQLPISAISGTSAGAIVASLLAYGVPFDTIVENIRKLKPTEWSSFRFRGLGLFHNELLREMLTKLLPENATIEGAKIPLALKVTDLISGKGLDLFEGDLIEAVMASSCVPGIYTPVHKDGRLLVDGALVENVPVSLLKRLGANFYVGVNLNGNLEYGKPDGIVDVLTNAMDIAIDSHTKAQLKACDLVISMDLTRYSRTQTQQMDQLIEEGYKAAQKTIGDLSQYVVRGGIRKLWRQFKLWLPFHLKIPELFKRFK